MDKANRKNGQRLGLCWGSVPGGGLMEIARLASANGLVPIAVTAGHYSAALEMGYTPGGIRRELDDLGVEVSIIDPLMQPLPGLPPLSEIDPAMQHFFRFTQQDCWRAGEALGAKTINLAHFLGGPVDLSLMQDRVAHIAEDNYRQGFRTTFEFIPGTGVPDLATAIAVTSVSDHARVMFDSWHFARSGGTLADLEALPADSIGGGQINDWLPPEPGAPYVPMSGRLAPGEGSLPLREMMERIEASSPGQDICMEVFSADLQAMGNEAAVQRLADAGRRFIVPAPASHR